MTQPCRRAWRIVIAGLLVVVAAGAFATSASASDDSLVPYGSETVFDADE